jgi:hypothetical protein
MIVPFEILSHTISFASQNDQILIARVCRDLYQEALPLLYETVNLRTCTQLVSFSHAARKHGHLVHRLALTEATMLNPPNSDTFDRVVNSTIERRPFQGPLSRALYDTFGSLPNLHTLDWPKICHILKRELTLPRLRNLIVKHYDELMLFEAQSLETVTVSTFFESIPVRRRLLSVVHIKLELWNHGMNDVTAGQMEIPCIFLSTNFPNVTRFTLHMGAYQLAKLVNIPPVRICTFS